MKLVATEDAVGMVLCHDMTQIVPGTYKGPRFKKGHVVQPEDIEVLLAMGKENLYVWEPEPGMVHEDDAAWRLAALLAGANTEVPGKPSEGKLNVKATVDGVLLVDSERLIAMNSEEGIMAATRRGGFGVSAGDQVAGTRVIPLAISEEQLEKVEAAAAGPEPILKVAPYVLKTAAVIATGSEVAKGLIEDAFTPVMEQKLAAFGIDVIFRETPGDGIENVAASVERALAAGVDLVVCTGGMSVDPDDNTPGGIRAAGARVVTYGSPVLPGAMLLVGYFDEVPGKERSVPVLGVPGCAMYNASTVLDLVLPRVAADVEITRKDVVSMGEGGLCLNCKPCTFPHCPFGR